MADPKPQAPTDPQTLDRQMNRGGSTPATHAKLENNPPKTLGTDIRGEGAKGDVER